MIEAASFYEKLVKSGVGFFTGVPDSLLKNFCAYITDHAGEKDHIIAVNEGAAVGLAAGFHLAAGRLPLVYMQNSGIGNAVNPLLSLADPEVYGIPMILVIGWRGQPGVHDEPQHIMQGKVTCELLEAMYIPYALLSETWEEAEEQVTQGVRRAVKDNRPFAFVVQKDTFAPYTLQKNQSFDAEMSREEAIEEIVLASGGGIFVSTTGMISRELYELRDKHGAGHGRDFLTVGSMGHASSIALGIALQKPHRAVTCLDGDGAALMHLGSMAAIGAEKPANLRHIVLNNGAHDSVGGQPTIAPLIDLAAIARACGYGRASTVRTKAALRAALAAAPTAGAGKERSSGHESGSGAAFIEVRVKKGSRKDLGRPKSTPAENKKAFMKEIN